MGKVKISFDSKAGTIEVIFEIKSISKGFNIDGYINLVSREVHLNQIKFIRLDLVRNHMTADLSVGYADAKALFHLSEMVSGSIFRLSSMCFNNRQDQLSFDPDTVELVGVEYNEVQNVFVVL